MACVPATILHSTPIIRPLDLNSLVYHIYKFSKNYKRAKKMVQTLYPHFLLWLQGAVVTAESQQCSCEHDSQHIDWFQVASEQITYMETFMYIKRCDYSYLLRDSTLWIPAWGDLLKLHLTLFSEIWLSICFINSLVTWNKVVIVIRLSTSQICEFSHTIVALITALLH
jgi:hypothetical protein